MSEKLIVSWEEYNRTVEKLAVQIDESEYKPTILIGIMRGAAPMIDVLSRIFKLKCAYLAVESYSGKGIEDIPETVSLNSQALPARKTMVDPEVVSRKGIEETVQTSSDDQRKWNQEERIKSK